MSSPTLPFRKPWFHQALVGLYLGVCVAYCVRHFSENVGAGLRGWQLLSACFWDVLHSFWWPLFATYGFF